MNRIEFLELSETSISDAGLAHLAHNRRVEQFWLEKTNITDASLPFIAQNRGLTHLDLDRTRVSDAGIELLAGLPELEVLALGGTKVTPRVLSTLESLPKLKYLYLMQTTADDSAVPRLSGLQNLRQIDLRYTQITPAGCAELRRALPSCSIEFEIPKATSPEGDASRSCPRPTSSSRGENQSLVSGGGASSLGMLRRRGSQATPASQCRACCVCGKPGSPTAVT